MVDFFCQTLKGAAHIGWWSIQTTVDWIRLRDAV